MKIGSWSLDSIILQFFRWPSCNPNEYFQKCVFGKHKEIVSNTLNM